MYNEGEIVTEFLKKGWSRFTISMETQFFSLVIQLFVTDGLPAYEIVYYGYGMSYEELQQLCFSHLWRENQCEFAERCRKCEEQWQWQWRCSVFLATNGNLRQRTEHVGEYDVSSDPVSACARDKACQF